MGSDADRLRERVGALVAQYHKAAFPPSEFVAGQTAVPVAGRVFDDEDMRYLVDASLDFWLTTGRFAEQFERELAAVFGVQHSILVNSGSSANLLALLCLTSPELGDRALRPKDEVITVAAAFPTTVNPIIQNRLVPVVPPERLGDEPVDEVTVFSYGYLAEIREQCCDFEARGGRFVSLLDVLR